MTSICELHKCIDELSSTIEHHRSVLRALESQQSDFKSRLNSILDPVTRLPLEISSVILKQCLPATPSVHSHQAPAVFLRVCRSWRDIALATPSMWTTISDKDVHFRHFDRALERWVPATGALPISLLVGTSVGLASVAGFAHRVHVLQLYRPSLGDLSRVSGQYSALNELMIGGEHKTGFTIGIRECIEFLEAAPSVSRCHFLNVAHFSEDDSSIPVLSHPFLQHIFFGLDCDINVASMSLYSHPTMLRYLTLPNLKTLVIPRLESPSRQIVEFLSRSSPPLQDLRLRVTRISDMAELYTLPKYFQHVPELKNFELGFGPFILFDVLQAVRLLRNPQHITIFNSVDHSGQYKEILDIILAHRTSMQSFRLLSRADLYPKNPVCPDDIANVLRELVRDGMVIQIGLPEWNIF
ncbi:hypothetical protein FB45DRAFT_278494 [Roridomyces roridus]|uniref:F-box domain-containing protein n=1 Tax=Roridomyces roridus TaxID=1738132 RepID=A0AAD7CAG2_9AGAR|nr:hypothetical protein FB45DRAFT_278494 [Roridomyces roridus]